MKAFQFPLEKVLSWRQRQLEKEEAELQGLLSRLQLMETRLAHCRRERDTAGKPRPQGVVAAGFDVTAVGAYRARLLRFIEDFTRQIADLKKAIERQQAAVLEARKRMRLLEKLKERRRLQWEAAFSKELEEFAGEAYLARWSASSPPGQ